MIYDSAVIFTLDYNLLTSIYIVVQIPRSEYFTTTACLIPPLCNEKGCLFLINHRHIFF